MTLLPIAILYILAIFESNIVNTSACLSKSVLSVYLSLVFVHPYHCTVHPQSHSVR